MNIILKRQRDIYRVTLLGSAVNMLLLIVKFTCGILGNSAAMIADAVHSLSDFLTDIIVLVFVKISGKPADSDHDYGHGKYETLASSIIGLSLLAVGIAICWQGVGAVITALGGQQLTPPSALALIAALLSIFLKEIIFRITYKVGERVDSAAVKANAWHHRSDALSSIGTALGIGGAVLLGERWAILDPIAAIIVSVFIVWASIKLLMKAISELLESSLPSGEEDEIIAIVSAEPNVSGIHNLRTRRIGNNVAMEMHVRMPGEMSLYHAHQHACNIEKQLRQRFGERAFISLHIEPLKINGEYIEPKAN